MRGWWGIALAVGSLRLDVDIAAARPFLAERAAANEADRRAEAAWGRMMALVAA